MKAQNQGQVYSRDPAGPKVEILGSRIERGDEVLNPLALQLLASLHRRFNARRLELLNARQEPVPSQALRLMNYLGLPLSILLAIQISFVVFKAFAGYGISLSPNAANLTGNTAAIGKELYTRYMLPFEVTSILLLVAIIGAIVMAKKDI